MDLSSKRSSSVLPAFVAVMGLAAAGAAVWFVNNQAPTPMQNTGADVGNSAAPKAAARSIPTYWSDDFGVAIDRIPLATDARPEGGEPGPPSSKGVRLGEPGGAAALAGKAGKLDRELRMENPYKVAEKAGAAESAPETVAPKPDKPPPPADQRSPLNRGAALAALGSASSSATGCKRPGGPSGGGSASVTFSPDGPVSSVNVSAPFGGTPVGACIQNAFRGARVPPFSGSSVTLSKSFRIPE